MLKEGIKDVTRFIIEHSDILVTRADKDNSTIIIQLTEYNNKIYEILADKILAEKTYFSISKDPTNTMTNQTHILLTR